MLPSGSLFLIISSLAAAVPSVILVARDRCYLQDYQGAAERVQKICENNKDPAGFFWQAALLQLLIYDSGNTGLLDSFYRVSDRVVEICRKRLKEKPDDFWAQFYWGVTELNRANCLSWQNRKFRAFLTLLKVPAHFKRALALEPGLYDAFFGLGVVEYFKATADRYCGGLGLIGSRERAYKLVREAQNKGVLLQPMAEFFLGFMAKEEREFQEAVQWCQRLLFRYPNNRSARRLLRDVYLDMGKPEEAIKVGRELEADIRKAFPLNRYGLAENWLKMAYAWNGLGVADSVLALSERIIAWERYQNSVPWLGNYVREAKRLRIRAMRGSMARPQ